MNDVHNVDDLDSRAHSSFWKESPQFRRVTDRSAIIADPKLRAAVEQAFYEYGHSCGRPPLLCIVAQTAAYEHGVGWLEELPEYLEGNIALALEYMQGTPLAACPPDGTFLL